MRERILASLAAHTGIPDLRVHVRRDLTVTPLDWRRREICGRHGVPFPASRPLPPPTFAFDVSEHAHLLRYA